MVLGLSLEPQPRLVQTLSQMLNPQMLAMLEVFNLPYLDLLEKINEEVKQNPLLEIKKPDELLNYLQSFRSQEKIGRQSESSGYLTVEALPANTNITLEQSLINQLSLAQLKTKDYQIGLELISQIDSRGYFPDYFKTRTEIIEKLGASRQKIDQVLQIIQTFEPDGVGARHLEECLLIQIQNYNFDNEELQKTLEKTVREHLEIVAQKNGAKLGELLEIPEEGAQAVIQFIEHNLNPTPAANFGRPEEARPVIPSFSVDFEAGKVKITSLEQKFGPGLTLNNQYLKILETGQADEKTLTFIKEKLKNAEQFLKNIERRQNTILKIVETICEQQKSFLKNEASWLEPLPQIKIAQTLDLDPSIISRAIAQKYLQTERCIFNLKFLCPREISGVTSQKIKLLLKDIITRPNQPHSISDEKIAQMLHQKGINISRRTVTKYRLELKLPSSHKK